jgi:hypothetical protein
MKPAVALASFATAAAAGIHLAVAPEHFREWWAFGVFFAVCGVAQLAWASMPWSAAVGIGGNAALIVLWALSRTKGLPFGPDAGTPEAVGPVDFATVILESVAVLALAVNRFAAGGEWVPLHQPHEETP